MYYLLKCTVADPGKFRHNYTSHSDTPVEITSTFGLFSFEEGKAIKPAIQPADAGPHIFYPTPEDLGEAVAKFFREYHRLTDFESVMCLIKNDNYPITIPTIQFEERDEERYAWDYAEFSDKEYERLSDTLEKIL